MRLSIILLVITLTFAALTAVALADKYPIETAEDSWCNHVFRRGGCAACEAAVECSACAPQDDTYHLECRAKTSEFSCDNLISSTNFISAETGQLCPNPIGPGIHQARIRNEGFNPNSQSDVQNSYRYSTFVDEKYCEIGMQFPFDRWAHSYFHSSDPSESDQMCARVNSQFGFRAYGGKNRYIKRDPDFNDIIIKTPEDLATAVYFGCTESFLQPSKRKVKIPHPYEYEQGRECIRLMQKAFCSVGCNAYDVAQGRICRDSPELAELYRVCADYTNGPEGPTMDGCPLDPNILPTYSLEEVKPSHCDNELKRVSETALFEDNFGLFDEDIPNIYYD